MKSYLEILLYSIDFILNYMQTKNTKNTKWFIKYYLLKLSAEGLSNAVRRVPGTSFFNKRFITQLAIRKELFNLTIETNEKIILNVNKITALNSLILSHNSV